MTEHPLREESASGPMVAGSEGVTVIHNPNRILIGRRLEHGEPSPRRWLSFSVGQAQALRRLLAEVLDDA